MGVTFAAVVTSLVNDIIMPVVGLASVAWTSPAYSSSSRMATPAGPYNTVAQAKAAGAVTINYGIFINTIIVFIIIALVLFFMVKAYMRTQKTPGDRSPRQGLPVLRNEHPGGGTSLPQLHVGAACLRMPDQGPAGPNPQARSGGIVADAE